MFFYSEKRNIKRKILNSICPICDEKVENLGRHIKEIHGQDKFEELVITAKQEGISDPLIGKIFGISFNQLEKIITEEYGINISNLKGKKEIKSWEPKGFRLESTSVWSFKKRGNWATHDSRYRGNWSPYIPRNIILRYSKPGDLVLDYFVGGGTTAIEAKLLGRRCIAKDINPVAIELTKRNLKFNIPEHLREGRKIYEPEVYVGDARDLSEINEKVDLICTHPPYSGIIKYSSKVEGDLSALPYEEFFDAMKKIASESYRVLKPGGKLAMLIGDSRKNRCVLPIGFETIKIFLEQGFVLKELIIKRQHNCKTTGFWYKRSIKYNFFLLAHEYLPVFEKPSKEPQEMIYKIKEVKKLYQPELFLEKFKKIEDENLETTTVWLFNKEDMEENIRKNLIFRYSPYEHKLLEIKFPGKEKSFNEISHATLLYVHQSEKILDLDSLFSFFKSIKKNIIKEIFKGKEKHIVFRLRDFREKGKFVPSALLLWDNLRYTNLQLREIIIVVEGDAISGEVSEGLEIVHEYLLIYKTNGGQNAGKNTKKC